MSVPLMGVVQLVLAGAAFAGLVFLISRSAVAGLCVVLSAFVLFEATSPSLIEGLVVPLGTFAIYPIDVTSLALLVVGVFRLFSERIYGPAKIALVTIVVSLVLHLAWGAAEFGMQHATNNSRLWFPVVSGLVYGATVRNWDRHLPTALIATGCFLAVFSIVQVYVRGLHAAETLILINGERVDARPVSAMAVLVMLEALILLFARGRLTPATAGLALLLASGVVLVQFRTLWVAAIAAAALGAFHVSIRYRASHERVVHLLTGIGFLLIPILLFAASRVGTYQASVASSTGDESTLTWRVLAWKVLIERHSSALDLLLGTPSGTGHEVVVLGQTTDRSAHNGYVEALLSFGLIGCFALTAVAVLALAARSASARNLEIAVPAVVVLIVCAAVVALTDQPDQVQGLLFGSLLAAACYRTQPSPAHWAVRAHTPPRLAGASR